MLELCRERWPRLEPVDNPGFSSKILLATGDGFELPSETQQCLNEVRLMMIIFSPIGRQYRTWRDATLWVACQEDENVELLRLSPCTEAVRSIVWITKSPTSIVAAETAASTFFGGSVAPFLKTFRKLQIPGIVIPLRRSSRATGSATPLRFPCLGKILP